MEKGSDKKINNVGIYALKNMRMFWKVLEGRVLTLLQDALCSVSVGGLECDHISEEVLIALSSMRYAWYDMV